MKAIPLLLFNLLIFLAVSGQTVETVVSHPKIIDGIHVDAAGNIYTSPGGLQGGSAIGKATPDGVFEPNFRGGFNGPIDIDEDADGRLFVTNYDNNTLKSYDPLSDELTTVVTGLDGPAGLTFDDGGNIFLTCFGAPPAYNGDQIIKVLPDGSSEIWLETSDFLRPQGITFDDEGNLWVANTPTGKIFKIDTITKVPVLMLELGNKVGNLVFRKKDRLLYFPSQGNHRIYRMDLMGNLDTLAGTGSIGSVDGAAMSSTFNKPLGLGFTASEDTLYVAEEGKLRRIFGLDEVATQTISREAHPIKIFPNPSLGNIRVEIPEQMQNRPNRLTLCDAVGRLKLERNIQEDESSIVLENIEKGTWYLKFYSTMPSGNFFVEKLFVF
ncbi:MAG: hypothetical protein KDC34_15340 [Saprospiraceae bacterium]|nr:hypothetical protein [Saprospiraceae bacterium]